MTTHENNRRLDAPKSEGLTRWARWLALAAGIAGVFFALGVAVGPDASGSGPLATEQSVPPVSRPVAARIEPAVAVAPGRERPSIQIDDEDKNLPAPQQLSKAFASVVERVAPAVVNIYTRQEGSSTEQPRMGGPFDDFFERFFRETPEQRRRSLGSGVIVDPRGYVITNNHVVENAKEIIVQFSDQRQFDAEVVGADPSTDLAVIQIKGDGPFPSARLGDSDALKVGEWLLAVGNPFGYTHTVTAGIVSAKGRFIGQGTYDDFIQTDAAINPGNSGGPLVSMRAEVVGINSNIISSSGGNMGIGFAIPSNLTRKIYDQLVSTGTVTRGWLGVGIQNLTPGLARSFGMEGKKGAVVTEILGPDSPAGKSGMEAGDVVVEFNGQAVESSNHLVHLVADVRPGSTVKVDYYRDGELRSADVTVDERQMHGSPAPESREPDERGRLGISGQNLTSEMASQLGASSRTGVVLVSVEPDGPAEDAGLRRGDIVIEANRQPVRSLDELQRAVADVPDGGDLLLRIERVTRGAQSSFLWIPVKLD